MGMAPYEALNSNFLLQATILGCEPSLMELFVETHVQIDDR